MATQKTEKSKKIGELFHEIDIWKERALRAEFKCKQLSWFRCEVNGCNRRQMLNYNGTTYASITHNWQNVVGTA